MTDLQRLNVKDFMDRLIYLTAQMNVARSFSPIRLCGKDAGVRANIDNFKDFNDVLEIYKISDSKVEISSSDSSTIYSAEFRGLTIVHVALKGDEGYADA